MNVLINAASAHMGGAVTYLTNVLRWLPRIAPDDNFVVIVPEKTRINLERERVDDRIGFITFPYADTGGLRRMIYDQVSIRRLIGMRNIDVLFSSTGFGTIRCPCPQVILIRNAAYFNEDFHRKYQELGRSLRTNRLRRKMSAISIGASDIVMFPTRAMRDMVSQFIALEEKEIRISHYGFDHDAFLSGREKLKTITDQLTSWKAGGYLILLNVSTYAVHKNFETLIEALPILRDSGVKVKLVTTTSRDRTSDKVEYDSIVARAEQLKVKEDWHELGYIPHERLHDLYTVSDAFVFPSFTESFGQSLVEASACCLPTIAADTPVNREICGDAGIYFEKFDPASCASQIQSVFENDSLHGQLTKAAKIQAEKFSWQTYTTDLVCAFRDLSLD